MNNIQLLSEPIAPSQITKPIELYIFIDPFCSKAVKMQTILRKLQIEYDHYFTWRIVISTDLTTLNNNSRSTKGCFSGAELDISHPVLPSIAIKAAELQGKRAALRFIQKLQEHIILQTKDVQLYSTLIDIAIECQLDIKEFIADFGSKEASRAFQCDLHITREMEIDEIPSIVFFNECIEDEGLKVSGLYAYDVYVQILKELLNKELIRSPLPSYDELFDRFNTMSTEEFAEIYSMPLIEAERELKKRMLQQKIECLRNEDVTLWRMKL
ncbi:DsbA family protein [Ureibacillus manganicus]|uniref:ClpXP adapter protein SpxH n=1 Tax=Ureibacillus manganicus DSM 26584 TaxID=1384049 RepID=A0A0A3I6Z7_9BACL|nr:DsbA family protein [Ureibacillus manganicus]KGR80556.1 dithiol-disulfide isomerase [Ureibacillus manganicus DSM 26584]